MAYCTQLEWDKDFPFERYQSMAEDPSSHADLPDGCLARIVGRIGSGARIFEIWESSDDARRFGEDSRGLLTEFKMPMPDRTAAFELETFRIRPAAG